MRESKRQKDHFRSFRHLETSKATIEQLGNLMILGRYLLYKFWDKKSNAATEKRTMRQKFVRTNYMKKKANCKNSLAV